MTIPKYVAHTNEVLKARYKFSVDLTGLEEITDELSNVLDVDSTELEVLSKETIMWANYLSEANACLSIYLQKYIAVGDIYKYLQNISKTDKMEFCLTAPKYKIGTRNYDKAILTLEEKARNNKNIINDIQKTVDFIDTQYKFMVFHHYRITCLLNSIHNRSLNAGNF